MRPLPILFSITIVLFSTAIVGCGGGSTGSGTEPQPLDAAVAEQWSGWAVEAQFVEGLVVEMYGRGAMTRELLKQQIERTQTLTDEIRSAEPSEEAALNLIESLDGMANALKFVLTFAENTGSLNVGGIEFLPIEDAVQQLSRDADALGEAAAQARD